MSIISTGESSFYVFARLMRSAQAILVGAIAAAMSNACCYRFQLSGGDELHPTLEFQLC
jgi:hypothetical protein